MYLGDEILGQVCSWFVTFVFSIKVLHADFILADGGELRMPIQALTLML